MSARSGAITVLRQASTPEIRWSGTPSFPPSTRMLEAHAFLWDRGQKRDLGTLGGRNSIAVSLNSRGQVIGFVEAAVENDLLLGFVPSLPTLWEAGLAKDLGTLGGKHGVVFIINRQGQVVGSSTLAG